MIYLFRFQYCLQLFVSVGAVAASLLLIFYPSGELLQTPPDMLKDSPFSSFLIPGIILFLVNGLGQLLAAILTFRRHRFAGLVGTIFGVGLMVWIFVQVNMIGGRNILQYSYFAIGVLETSLAFLIQKNTSPSRSV